ncbi:acyltransferase [Legionella steigerwaltii]|uniref:Acyltransferase n=1 Tax=Legionella steigerwaltii TaxID=460 RepID=A0A378L614_9GAMM|nr:1-acyl-sn-glycerol-3-phosphate acyltransferase [Legionella steigerwaltii]KTD77363.1 acyltransferase [Legionella steigerwaltii]STY22243.1 acyltransferase [Legionella steigerwaltii]
MKKLGRFILKLFGWKVVGALPQDKKYLVVVAPHTSNWDFLVGLFARFSVGVKINFLAKNQLFFFPLGLLLRALGGAPVDRSKKSKTVEQVVDIFRSRDEFKLAITPEGTRGPVTRWKEGFYHIACQAGLPIVMVGPDYASKELRIHEKFQPSGDIDSDFPKILDFFRTIRGCYPKEIPDYHSKK